MEDEDEEEDFIHSFNAEEEVAALHLSAIYVGNTTVTLVEWECVVCVSLFPHHTLLLFLTASKWENGDRRQRMRINLSRGLICTYTTSGILLLY